MARGDVISWWGTMTNTNDVYTLRPGSGVSICLTSATGSYGLNIGSNTGPGGGIWQIAQHVHIGANVGGHTPGATTNMKIFSTNAIYTSIVSSSNGDTTWIASGIVTKD